MRVKDKKCLQDFGHKAYREETTRKIQGCWEKILERVYGNRVGSCGLDVSGSG